MTTLGDDWKKMAGSAPAPELTDEELPELVNPDPDFVKSVMDALPLVGNTEEEIAEMVEDYGAGRIERSAVDRPQGGGCGECITKDAEIAALKARLEAAEAVCHAFDTWNSCIKEDQFAAMWDVHLKLAEWHKAGGK